MAEPKIIIIGKLHLMPRETAAQRLGVSTKTLRLWELDKKGPPVTRIGAKVLYEEAALERWLAKLIAKAEAGG